MANLLYRVSFPTIFGTMLSSLYFIDQALGRGFTVGLSRVLCLCKCSILAYAYRLRPLREFPIGTISTDRPVSILLSVVAILAALLLLLGLSRNGLESRVNDLLVQSKMNLRETYSTIDKWKKHKKSLDYCRVLLTNSRGRVHSYMKIPDNFNEDVSTKGLSHKDAASGDCGPDALGATSRHVFYLPTVHGDDVIRISGRDDEDIDQIFGLDPECHLCDVVEEDDISIDESCYDGI